MGLFTLNAGFVTNLKPKHEHRWDLLIEFWRMVFTDILSLDKIASLENKDLMPS